MVWYPEPTDFYNSPFLRPPPAFVSAGSVFFVFVCCLYFVFRILFLSFVFIYVMLFFIFIFCVLYFVVCMKAHLYYVSYVLSFVLSVPSQWDVFLTGLRVQRFSNSTSW